MVDWSHSLKLSGFKIHLRITDPEMHYSNLDYANCGASMLSDVWIITAAHCFSERKSPKVLLLVGQNVTKKSNYQEIEYDKIIIHPKYEEFMGTHEYSTNDIALIKLNSKFRIRSRVIPLCLPQRNAVLPVNAVCYITGFGATSKMDTEQVKRIREGRVTIKDDKVCVKSLSLDYFDNDSMICAGKSKSNRANSCQGLSFQIVLEARNLMMVLLNLLQL
jgi:secreted trypsin-like serine protease